VTAAPDSVFDKVTRIDASPAKHSESTLTFLNRVAGDYWDQIRDLVSQWAANVPAASRADLRGRLRAPDNRQFWGAFWELYNHESLVRGGYDVEIHPPVDGASRQPDFLASRGETRFYVEAKALIGRDPNPGATARKQRLYDALDTIDSPNFFLAIDVNAVGATDLRTGPLRSKLERWLRGLNPDTTELPSIYNDEGETFVWLHDGWDLSFRPISVRPEARGKPDHRVLGIFGPVEMTFVSDDVLLREALADKGRAYGDLDFPLVVAINVFGFSHDNFDTMNALYGTYQLQISLVDRDSPPVPVRAPDGYWAAGTWAHGHVAGVLVARSMDPWRVIDEIPTFWPHPEPDQAVPPLPIWKVAEPMLDHIEYRDATMSAPDFFGLGDVLASL
jgi:hypothetical protein